MLNWYTRSRGELHLEQRSRRTFAKRSTDDSITHAIWMSSISDKKPVAESEKTTYQIQKNDLLQRAVPLNVSRVGHLE